MLFESYAQGPGRLTDVRVLTGATMDLLHGATLVFFCLLVLGLDQVGAEGVGWLVVRGHSVLPENPLELL